VTDTYFESSKKSKLKRYAHSKEKRDHSKKRKTQFQEVINDLKSIIRGKIKPLKPKKLI